MKKLISLSAALLVLGWAAFAQTDFDGVEWKDIKLDCTQLQSQAHPRLLLSDSDIKNIKKEVGRNRYLGAFHQMMLSQAEGYLEETDPLVYQKDASGKRILAVSRDALCRIVSLSYAYRITGGKQYLKKAEWHISTICDFPDWNPSHFLDPSEMSLAVAIGYDWLNKGLSPEVAQKAASRLRDFAMEPAAHGEGQHIFGRDGNWNQVCIACMTAAAIATWENNPELSYEIFQRGLEGNIRAAKKIYAPDGAFPEGPGYWEYGTCYQEYLNLLLEGAFGTDFGLSKIQGFDNTGLYKAFTRSGCGHIFNYSDNSDRLTPSPGLWYMAWKFGTPGILYDEIPLLESKEYPTERRLLLALICSYRLGSVKIGQLNQKMFVSRGVNHILMVKSSWDESGGYLGLKGGSPDAGHSHMDAGSFVFDAYGTRWVSDYYLRNYAKQELIFQKLGLSKDMWAYQQDSYRWYLFQYNNRQHSTLTVNDHNHRVDGFASLQDTWDTPEKTGGRLDMTPVFGEDLSYASRSASLIDGGKSVEIVDTLKAPDGKPARVRFTIVTPAKAKVAEDCIILSDGAFSMVLRCNAPGAQYKTWSADPKDYDSPTAFGEPALRKTMICGYEYDIPAGMQMAVTTIIKKK